MIYDFLVIGCGASGLFFGASPAFKNRNLRGLILEKTKHPGTKLLMSGSGQCNITHSGSIKDFVNSYGAPGKKIRSALYKYSNDVLIDFLNDGGVPTICREDGKIFPRSMKAKDILDLLLKKINQNGFEIRYSSPVIEVNKTDDSWEVKTPDQTYIAKSIIVATGGCSYPTTGSDGQFFDVLKNVSDIDITPLKPALAAIRVRDYGYTELSGISFRNVKVRILPDPKKGGKMKAENIDDLLFTHSDISGPAVLNISKYANTDDILEVNYLYPKNYEEVFSRLKEVTKDSSADLHNVLIANFDLPRRFCKIITENYGPSIKSIAKALTGESFVIKSTGGFANAMATNGGVVLSQLDLKSFKHKTLAGLYVIGEACDIDGATGGYNLQFAFSSAWAAAENICE